MSHIPNVTVFKNGRWERTDGSLPTFDELMATAIALENETYGVQEFKYSHCEIEAACGGELALEVRAKVIARREKIKAYKS